MKRQKIRRIILLISFLLFPITIYYLSPYLIIQGGSEGIITGSFIMFIAMFISSLLFGRAFCGWLCPAGGLQDCCSAASDKRAKGGRRNWIKYFIWVPWIAWIILAFISSGEHDVLFSMMLQVATNAAGGFFVCSRINARCPVNNISEHEFFHA